MLILSRKSDESIILTLPDGRQIRVVVHKIQGNRVYIGLECPKDINITRAELGFPLPEQAESQAEGSS